MKGKEILVEKASGDRVPFSWEKVRSSLVRSGASEEAIVAILPSIESLLRPGISTREIYKMAYQMLKADCRHIAGRYKLKEALLELGPSGFPFEKFIGELFRQQGYKIEVGVTIQGACVTHEMDVDAVKGHERIMVECKYHNKRGVNTDVKVPLYVHSRFQDIQKYMAKQWEHEEVHFQPWLVTNTRFSDDAMKFAHCVGLQLMAWDYPVGKSLRELIYETGTHPITCMSTLSAAEKRSLLEQSIVFCREIPAAEPILHKLGFSKARIQKIKQEAERITFH